MTTDRGDSKLSAAGAARNAAILGELDSAMKWRNRRRSAGRAGSVLVPAVLLAAAVYWMNMPARVGVPNGPGPGVAIAPFPRVEIVKTGSLAMVYRLFAPPSANIEAPRIGNPTLVYPLLMTAIFLAHFFCWHLGLIYRDRFAHFPWIMQRHVSARVQNELERAAAIRAQRRKPNYVKKA